MHSLRTDVSRQVTPVAVQKVLPIKLWQHCWPRPPHEPHTPFAQMPPVTMSPTVLHIFPSAAQWP
jgi:hypothetical protein